MVSLESERIRDTRGENEMTILTAAQVASQCHEAGFAGEALLTAVAIAKGESGFESGAVGDTTLVDTTWGPSIGLFQIRSLHAEHGTGSARDELANHDPRHNVEAAWLISRRGTDFTPWSVFTSGMYRRHLDAVRAACAAVDAGVGPMGASGVLRIGDTGPAVSELQERLTAAGFPCTADGEFGVATERAVLEFQASRRLVTDGIVGPETLAALRSAGPVLAGEILREGDSGPAVAELQRRLTDAGFPCVADGDFGPMTAEAVRALQAARGLDVDGIVGPQTAAALLAVPTAPVG
jgi:peptidoglycan hydrolase-like protein with peptidoglycan-binding domain